MQNRWNLWQNELYNRFIFSAVSLGKNRRSLLFLFFCCIYSVAMCVYVCAPRTFGLINFYPPSCLSVPHVLYLHSFIRRVSVCVLEIFVAVVQIKFMFNFIVDSTELRLLMLMPLPPLFSHSDSLSGAHSHTPAMPNLIYFKVHIFFLEKRCTLNKIEFMPKLRNWVTRAFSP